MLRLIFTRTSRLAVVPCVTLLACGPADAGTTADASTTAAVSTTADASSGTGDPGSSGDASSSDTSASASDPTTAVTTTTTAATSGEPTTGDAEFCQGWETAEGEPYLALHDRLGAPLADGGTLAVECGGQGVFMFGLYPTFGGFLPASEIVNFTLVVDVEGFNTNPEGHFYSADPVGYYLSCDPIIGGVIGVLPVFPLDNLDDLTVLDGKPAHVQVSMATGGAPVVVELDLTLAVVPDDSWGFCGG